MKYKSYSARIEYSEEDGCLVGHIAGITDIVGFHGDTISELQEAFEEAVEDYLEMCQRLNKPPQKPYSGDLRLRIPPDIHVAIARAAKASGKDLEQWITDTFSHAIRQKSQIDIEHYPDSK
ncbi:MAG: type II toxin-antitoxin system HicB family antitoxin [Candidatus Poribacteria bacterium]|nr:type II toxin-antitoxin system HicB family antitoxin [Candidatus Poribacteria bacterium]MDE0314376.1 type II toxin-antitoxin system HicB family antitoxin [Candidatus Poribacteria bacterium]